MYHITRCYKKLTEKCNKAFFFVNIGIFANDLDN